MGRGADDGHVALEDIDELWQFVEAAAAEEVPEGGDARVVVELLAALPFVSESGVMREDGMEAFIGMLVHGAEFPDADGLAVFAETAGAIDDGAWAGDFDGGGDKQQEWPAAEQGEDGQYALKNGFEDAAVAAALRRALADVAEDVFGTQMPLGAAAELAHKPAGRHGRQA